MIKLVIACILAGLTCLVLAYFALGWMGVFFTGFLVVAGTPLVCFGAKGWASLIVLVVE